MGDRCPASVLFPSESLCLMSPASKNILAISCINVGVGPGGTTSMVGYDIPYYAALRRVAHRSKSRRHRRLSRPGHPRHVCRAHHEGTQRSFSCFFLGIYLRFLQVTDHRTATTGIEASHLSGSKFKVFLVISSSYVLSRYSFHRRSRGV